MHSECLTGDIIGSLRCDCGAQLEQALAAVAAEGVGAQILGDLGITRIRLITNNPAKYGGLEGYGLTIVGRVALPVIETAHNVRYLRTRRERMGHDIGVGAAGT